MAIWQYEYKALLPSNFTNGNKTGWATRIANVSGEEVANELLMFNAEFFRYSSSGTEPAQYTGLAVPASQDIVDEFEPVLFGLNNVYVIRTSRIGSTVLAANYSTSLENCHSPEDIATDLGLTRTVLLPHEEPAAMMDTFASAMGAKDTHYVLQTTFDSFYQSMRPR